MSSEPGLLVGGHALGAVVLSFAAFRVGVAAA
jgi:hypothetical protein